MCGIVGYIGNKEATPILLYGLAKLEYRGYDSAGVAIHNGKDLNIVKSKGRLSILEEKLKDNPLSGSMGIGHTRWATHGAPSDVNSHPLYSENSSIAVVHNGIIENYMHLREELIAEGFNFITETDTETCAHLIDFYYKKGSDFIDAIFKAVERIQGSYALGIVCKDFPGKIVAARKDSPLVVGIGKGENFIASDVTAILNHTRDVYIMDDNEIAVLSKDNIEIFDQNKKLVKKDIFTVNWDIQSAEKGGYDHFMLKEIFEQPKVVSDTLTPRLKEDHIMLDEIKLSKKELEEINKIYIVGCGTAYHAGLIGKYIIEKQIRIPVFTDFASEFRYKNPIIDNKTLVILISQSGETADTLAALRLAKKYEARILAVVNVVGSSIAREADDIFYTLAGPEISVASTKAFSSQVAAMYLIMCHLALELGKMSKDEYKTIREDLASLPELINNILSKTNHIERLAKKYLNVKNVFYIGRGVDYLVAMEGSLKLKEIAYIHSESYAAGELKHGPIALIEESTLIVGIVAQEDLFDKTVSNMRECKTRGAKVLAIAMDDNKEIEKYVDDVFYIPRTNLLFTSLLANIPQQLFSYYMAAGLGNDVDKPRNLAKSVCVE